MPSYEQACDVILFSLLDNYPRCCVGREFCRAGVKAGHTGGRCLSDPPKSWSTFGHDNSIGDKTWQICFVS